MCKLLKVSGRSLLPVYNDGDYVVVASPPWVSAFRPGDVVVFHRPDNGHTTIKEIEHIQSDSKLFVVGTHEHSVDSRQFGPISRTSVIGKVVWHVRR